MIKFKKAPFFAPQLYHVIKTHYYEEILKKKNLNKNFSEKQEKKEKPLNKNIISKVSKLNPLSKTFIKSKITKNIKNKASLKPRSILKISTYSNKVSQSKIKNKKFTPKTKLSFKKEQNPKTVTNDIVVPKFRAIVFKTVHRSSTILPCTNPFSFLVDNGRIKTLVNINPNIIGHKFGEFTKTRRRYYYRNKKRKNRGRKK